MPTLALLDGHSLAYRAFYALPPDLATASGQVTNAVFGFTSMLIKLMDDERPDAIAVAWDVRGPTFRTEAYDQYKAQREKAPDLFTSQLPLIDEVLDVMGITQIRVPGFEADDVIATLATRAKAEGWDVSVITGDRDAFQLIEPGVTVLYTLRGISETVKADAEWLEGRYGVKPSQYVDYAALRGDPSDNLPGVPGVGEKTAAKLIGAYGTVDGVLDAIADQTPKLRENLEASRDQILLNRRLMDLVRDVDVDAEVESFTLHPLDQDRIRPVFDALAFRGLWDRLAQAGGLEGRTGEVIEAEVVTMADPSVIDETFRNQAAAVDPVWDDGCLTGAVVAGSPATFVPAGSLDSICGAAESIAGHDIKAFVRALIELGLTPPCVSFDTALAAWIANPSQRVPNVADLTYRELGVSVDDGTGQESESQGAFNFDGGADLEAAARRSIAIEQLITPLTQQLSERGGLELYEEIELPLIPILARMEVAGIGVDTEFLVAMGDQLRSRLADLEESIHSAAGGPFNVNSTLQLREVLFDRLGLPITKKTPKGAPSTDASVLEKLRGEHEIVADLLTYRELEKLRSTYVEALLRMVSDDGRIRGRFNQMGAATGRLSQEQPNLQNIPIRSEEGRAIRKAFISAEGHTFLVADYSQIELRILAHLSNDPGLVDAFEQDLDVHTATAARIYELPPDDVTTDHRRRAKMINFGLLYGMEAYGLAQRLDISRDEAQNHIDTYFAQFPDVRDFLQGLVERARADGYTTTILGRRRYLPELTSDRFRDRQAGERMALNAPIQGSAADVIKKAMIDLDPMLVPYEAQTLLQIHDELVIEVPDENLEAVAAITRSVMEEVVQLRVPLKVDMATGRTLAECKS
ncbi:MAG: DNA polymerase I [Actinomycetota bacterium]|nr:DNA polymerase I [Actinomycetota bacterium]